MRLGKRVSPEATALIEAIRDHKPKDRGWLRELLPSLIQGVLIASIGGLIGVYGAAYGARTTGDTQFKLEQQRNAHDDQQQHAKDLRDDDLQRQRDARVDAQLLLSKAEQIVILVEKTVITNEEVTQAILAMPYQSNHMAALPDDAEQVTALVTLYFPNAVADARVYETKCAQHVAAVQEVLIARLKGASPSTADNQIYQDALNAGDLVIYDVMKAVGKTYQKRNPLSPAEVRGLQRQ